MKSSIYFITDCHFSEEGIIDDDKIVAFGKIIGRDENPYVYLAVSGDVAFSGKSIEYDLFCEMVDKLKKTSNKNIKLITCPGNHDIYYNEDEEYTLEILKEDTKIANVDEASSRRVTKMASYLSFESSNINFIKDDKYLSHITFNEDEKEIVFYSLNNVLFSCYGKINKSDVTKNYAYLSDSTIHKIKKSNPNQIVFLLMHFPIDYFNDKTSHELKERITRNVDVVLNGHLHVPEKGMFIGDDTTTIIQGDFFFKQKQEDKSSFVKIDLNKQKYCEFSWQEESYLANEKEKNLDLSASRLNIHNISFNNDFYSYIKTCNILNREFSIDDIFVFPYLSQEKYEDVNNNESSIKEFSTLHSKIKSNAYIFIYGDESSGKTSLSKYLTYLLFNENYFPILCSGDQFIKYDDINKFIRARIRDMYSGGAISKFENDVPNSSKILIIDDYSQLKEELLSSAASFFKSIIVISKTDEKQLINKPKIINNIEVPEYTIQPMVKSKRREFTFKLYECLSNRGEKSGLSKEKFYNFIEKQLSMIAINDVCDPVSLAYIEINAFHSTDLFDNNLFSNVNQAKSLILLDDINQKNSYNYETRALNRVISNIAYAMYNSNKQEFSASDITDGINDEVINYGDQGMDEQNLSSLMLESLIIKRRKTGNFTFFNRDIFAYYIAIFIRTQLIRGDDSYFKDLLSKDIYIPLNFNILLCLSSIYNEFAIPNKIIDMIDEQAKDLPLLCEDNFSVLGVTKEKKEELKNLTPEDIKKINEKEDEREKEKHKKYLANRDNLYYADVLPPKEKEIVEWLDKLKISCVLLKRFSGQLLLPYKQKLVNLVIKLPNLVLYKFNDYIFKRLDKIYASMNDENNKSIKNQDVDAFNNYIISFKRAFILSTYDYGSRCFTDNACKEVLKELVKAPNSELQMAQNLMFESFLTKGEDFVKNCTELLNNKKYKDNSFIKTSARLIGRRYIIENYELCNHRYQTFVNLVFGSLKNAYKAIGKSEK